MKKKKNQNKDPKTELKTKILSKFTTGRTKSHMKRKKTLLQEYKYRNKANKFVDRRIGERNKNMTVEDRMLARFAAERVKKHKKKTMYNLGDEDGDSNFLLTHRGMALQEIEKYEDPRSDEDDDDMDSSGRLDANYVKEAHFGGGLFKKVAEGDSKHHNIIDQLIAESKKKKYEQQLAKERTLELTDKLDKDLKELLSVVAHSHMKKPREESEPAKTKESYDVLVRELKFEAVGKPTEKVKTELEMEIEQKQQLELLEKERVERMKRKVEEENEERQDSAAGCSSVKKHCSADDLDDGLDLDLETEGQSSAEEEEEEEEEEGDNDYEEEGEVEEEEEEDSNNEGGVGESEENTVLSQTGEVLSINNEDFNFSGIGSQLSTKDLMEDLNSLTYSQLKQRLVGCSVGYQVNTLKTLIRSHQPTSSTSKETFGKIFPLILEHIDHVASTSKNTDCWSLAEQLAPDLFDMTQVCPVAVAQCVLDKVVEKQERYSQLPKRKITTDILVLLKLIPLLFPTSDYYHHVVTPATLFLCQILSQTGYKSVAQISSGIFCVTLVLEYIKLSSRYIPEAVTFLKKMLSLCTSAEGQSVQKSLSLVSDHASYNVSANELCFNGSDLLSCDREIDDAFRIKVLYLLIKLMQELERHTEEYAAAGLIWEPHLKLMDQIIVDKYPAVVREAYRDTHSQLTQVCSKPLSYLTPEKKRPKALKLYEPNIRPIIDGKSFRTISQVKQEREKLLHTYKKELKGAMKEIRKDRNFLASVKFSEQAKRDAERRAKVKQIYSWGESQQSELKKFERKKKK